MQTSVKNWLWKMFVFAAVVLGGGDVAGQEAFVRAAAAQSFAPTPVIQVQGAMRELGAEPPSAGPENKRFSNGQLSLVIREAQRNGRHEFWVHQVQLKTPNGWQTILDGVDGGEFSTSLGGASAALLKYVDEMTTNMELLKRGSGPDEPYYDRRHSGSGLFAPKTHNGVARGGQCCCLCAPIIFVIGPGIAVEPLLALSQLTGDSFYRQMAAEMASYIGHSQIDAPGKPWHGGVIHAFLMYCGQSHGPDREGQVDTGMATGSSLAALEAWLADPARSGEKQKNNP